MHDDFAVIRHALPREYTHTNIYDMADAHIGAKESSLATLRAWVQRVLDDPYGYVIIAGDMINNGIRDSKTNVYEEVMPPRQQKRVCIEIFKPLADKWKRCRVVVLPALLVYAAYAVKKEYTPQIYGSIPVITLSGTRKRVDYHEYDAMLT